MAIYSLSTSSIKRSNGRSAVAAAAYRAGDEIANERTGLVHDYSRKLGVEHVEIFTRSGVPAPEMADLWNDAERAEKRKDGRTAREVLVALPAELDGPQRLALARGMTADLAERYGVAAQLAVHAPDRDGDQRNYHAHILLTTRAYGHDGLGKKAQLEWSGTQCRKYGVAKPADELYGMRERWAAMQNSALERAAVAARVDHRSLADQGIDRVPQIHVGPMGTEQIRRGTPEESERASLNLEIKSVNAEVEQLRERLLAEREATEEARRQEAAREAERQKAERLEAAREAERQKAERLEAAREAERQEAKRLEAAREAKRLEAAREAKRLEAAREAERQKAERLEAAREAERQKAERLEAAQEAKRLEAAREAERQKAERLEATPRPALEPKPQAPEPKAPAPPAFDAEARAREIIKMPTADERAGAVRDAMSDLDEHDALSIELEGLLDTLSGELTPDGQRLRAELLPPERPQEPSWEPPSGPSGPGM